MCQRLASLQALYSRVTMHWPQRAFAGVALAGFYRDNGCSVPNFIGKVTPPSGMARVRDAYLFPARYMRPECCPAAVWLF